MSHWLQEDAPLPGLPDKGGPPHNNPGWYSEETCWKDVLNEKGATVCCTNEAAGPLGLCPEHEAWLRGVPWDGEVSPPPSVASFSGYAQEDICRAFAMNTPRTLLDARLMI